MSKLHAAADRPPPLAGALPRADATVHLVGVSKARELMVAQLQRIAASEAPTLIEGETGSGKELAARAIHYGGARRAGPFVPVNCGALPEALIEAELFGHERGAFTDARHARRGLVAEAGGGTLFLDEVDALSPKAQVSLLRFLQDQRYRPVGTSRELHSDVRLVAAANRPLAQLIEGGEFRADLMYRLKILHLTLPPLRERLEDVEPLARHFIDALARKYRSEPKGIEPSTLQWMCTQRWPGNVRELENWVHRQFLMCSGDMLRHEESPGSREEAAAPAPATCLPSFQQAKAEALRAFECDYLRQALDKAAGNVTRAARLAGKERRAFGKLMKKHGIGGRAAAG